MASGPPPLLPVTTAVAASNGHGRRCGAAGVIKACCLLILLVLLPLCMVACNWNQTRVAFQHMSWRLEGEYDDRIRFESWMHKYNRSYVNDPAVREGKFRIFRDNLRYVDNHNAAGNYTYRLGLNGNADWAYEQDPDSSISTLSSLDKAHPDRRPGEVLPASVDWRLKGAVGPIRSQRKCGSCWAIAAAEAVEGIHQIATGEDLVPLSVQEIVDCDDWMPNHGCSGGYEKHAMEYVMVYGLHTERDYPYVDEKRSCRNKLGGETVRIASYGTVPAGDERSLQRAVAGQPVAVSADFEGRDMAFYESGVYNGPCGESTNHAVLVVGYGSTEGGKDFWIVKNSWGEDWGEGGYIRIQRNSKEDPLGKCVIATMPIYPKLSLV